MIQSFEPLAGDSPKVLILGSMPGVESLKQQMYYAHKHNRLWRILFSYFGVPYCEESSGKKRLAVERGIALYDVFRCCDRVNSSLDSKIKNGTPNDIEALLRKHPTIKAVLINGRKAQAGYAKYFPHLKIQAETLPSTSPANAAFGYEKLFGIWKAALDKYLIEN